jgi:ribosomal protein S18 acetylase RimI-like enzyme
MTTGSIRLAQPQDLPAIERIVHDAYVKYADRIGKKPGPMLDDYRARVAEQSVWVMDDGDAVMGLVVLLQEDDHVLLDNVAVDPSSQGRGVGRALMAFAEEEARRRGFREIRLYTHQLMHENVALYPHLGYEETGRGEQAGYARVFFRKRLKQ